MTAENLHTVTFQAAKTNSTPPPLPYHIEQGLRGEVGTTRFSSTLSGLSEALAKLIALFNFGGILFVSPAPPIITCMLALCVLLVSLSLPGLFHGIPYLEQRRASWTQTNKLLFFVCFAVSLAASSWISYFLIFNPPKLPSWVYERLHSPAIKDIHAIRANASDQCFSISDPYRRSLCRQNAASSLWPAKAEESSSQATQTASKSDMTDEEYWYNIGIWIMSIIILGVVHGIAAYGAPFGSEAGNAIWREPHSGYRIDDSAQKAPEDPEAKIKRRGLDAWLQSNGVAIGTGSETAPVDKVFEEYRKSFASQLVPPPMYDLSTFKAAFKAATGKEPMEKGGIMVYTGVNFPSAGLI